jgi:lipopolysaccharide biosynthesis protein
MIARAIQGSFGGRPLLRRLRATLRRLRSSGQGQGAGLYECFVRNALANYPASDHVAIASEAPAPGDVRLVAYYLPQFHPIAENDEWWGKGFTEWRNVTRAFPVFEDHYQPRSPGELGYYDLRVPDIMRRQIALAKLYGIGAFCFHYYWFAGKRLLELPLENYLKDSHLDFPFCLCWANENWSRRWSGSEKDVLIAQSYSAEDDIALIRDLDRYFRDGRYLKIDGKPVFTVYRPDLFPDMRATIGRWRAEIERLGYPGIYLIATNAFDFSDYQSFGFDALSEFPPHGVDAPNIESTLSVSSLRDGGRVRNYETVVAREIAKRPAQGVVHPGVMPSWDNSPRRPTSGVIYHGSTPGLFRKWLISALHRARTNPEAERLVFINAWNEWAEGAYLEPDLRFGYGYLDACAGALGAKAGAELQLVEEDLPGFSKPILARENAGPLRMAVAEAMRAVKLPPSSRVCRTPLAVFKDRLVSAQEKVLGQGGFGRRDIQRAKQKFDSDFYLQSNPEVAASGVSPFKHYLRIGWKEGRDPNPDFSTLDYLAASPDIRRAEENPFVHYVVRGSREGRKPTPSRESYGRYASSLTKTHSAGRAAIVVHVFYQDIFDEILDLVRPLPPQHKMFVSTVREQEDVVRSKLENSGREFTLRVFPNRGRDVLPFFKISRDVRAEGFEFIVKVHTKKSPHRKDGHIWRRDMLRVLLSGQALQKAVDAFATDPALGLIGPQGNYRSLSRFMGANRERVFLIGALLGLDWREIENKGFYAGTMFIARTEALAPLLDIPLSDDDFEMEEGQIDGTLSHALERCIVLSVAATGQRLVSSGSLDCDIGLTHPDLAC